MSLFTTRVELHNATAADDYQKLHDEMDKEGFKRTIQRTGEVYIYQLPTAEYNYWGEKTTDQILELAKKAATRTGKKFSLLVTKVDGAREWYNLAIAPK